MGFKEWNLSLSQGFQPKRKGILGAFLLGLFFGIISSPCRNPHPGPHPHLCCHEGRSGPRNVAIVRLCVGHCALIFLAGTATGFVESFMKVQGHLQCDRVEQEGWRIDVVLVGIYFVYMGITL